MNLTVRVDLTLGLGELHVSSLVAGGVFILLLRHDLVTEVVIALALPACPITGALALGIERAGHPATLLFIPAEVNLAVLIDDDVRVHS